MFFILNLNFRCVNNQVYPAKEFSRFVAAQLFALLHQSAEKKIANGSMRLDQIYNNQGVNEQLNHYQPLSLIPLILSEHV